MIIRLMDVYIYKPSHLDRPRRAQTLPERKSEEYKRVKHKQSMSNQLANVL